MSAVLILSGLVLGAALVAPFVTTVGPRRRRDYGRENRDDQSGNGEDRAYRVFLGEQHQKYRGFRSLGRDDQQRYFRWRREHPDQILFKVQSR